MAPKANKKDTKNDVNDAFHWKYFTFQKIYRLAGFWQLRQLEINNLFMDNSWIW